MVPGHSGRVVGRCVVVNGPANADMGRRGFFRQGLGEMLGPVADFLEKRMDLPTVPRMLLRPPGALAEADFLATCYRCGNCVEACPADAITLLPPGRDPKPETPSIDANKAACVVCEGLLCTHACPSGALRPLDDPAQIRMGLARVLGEHCVRAEGEDCTICVDRCPIGSRALIVGETNLPEVLAQGCVGCGICQLYCPTEPKAIVVEPL